MAVDYSRHASEYDLGRADEALDRGFWLPSLLEIGRIGKGERVLDIGAGTGRFARLLSETTRVVALDPSPAMLAVARAKGGFECARGDAHRLPFHPETFDSAILVMVLHHLRDMRAALREVGRVCRKIAIATSDMEKRRLGILEEAFPSLLGIDRGRFPAITGVVTALEAAGFRDIQIEERPYLRSLSPAAQLERVRRRYLSTFDLLPPGEFDRGLRFLEAELPRRHPDGFEQSASFTFLGATR